MEDEFRPRALFCRELRRAQVPRYIVNEGGAPWIGLGRVRVGWSGWLALTGTTTGRKKEEERIKEKIITTVVFSSITFSRALARFTKMAGGRRRRCEENGL